MKRHFRHVVAVFSVLLLSCAPGCEKPLFSENGTRSQYDRFDAVRDRRPSAFVWDEFGSKRPNLRARLAPRE
jgi:hypothetical protein